MTTLYGIRNCDSIKKTRQWLDVQAVEYDFHDYKKSGITASQLKAWSQRVDWQLLLNRRGTTWKKLPQITRDKVNKTSAIKLMCENPSMIKRPVLVHDDRIIVGFDPVAMTALLELA